MITELLTLQNQLRIYHWQTESYAEHKALDETYSTLNELIDEFIEGFQGKYAKIRSKEGFSLQLENYNGSMSGFIDKNIEFLTTMDKNLEEGYNQELLNLRDEMVESLQKLKYLLTLK
jgi:hypothetical protein